MARRFRKSVKVSQRQYRARKAKYREYLASTGAEQAQSYREWSAIYRQKKTLRKKYKEYLDQFNSRKRNFESRGLDFYDPNPLTYRDWKTVYAEKSNDLRQDIKEGKRKTVGNVNTEIVSDQAYELSSKQGEVVAEYLLENESETLEELDLVYKYVDENGVERVNLKKKIELLMKIRQGEFISEEVGLWDMINDFRMQMFKKGMTKEEVRQAVGQTFFKSE